MRVVPLESSDSYKVPPQFIPLKPGAIHPEGWLKDWANSAANGITGQLDAWDAVFEHGYKGYHFQAQGVKENGTGWPLEQCAYWLDGLVRLAYILEDEKLIEKAKSRLDPVVEGVLKGGDSFIYWQPKSILNDTFNNWSHSHMGRALVAYYQATGEKRILNALVKVYREYPLPDMPTDEFAPVSGAVNLDPLFDTYAMSGDVKVLQNALAYASRETFHQLTKDWASGKAPDGHGVIFYENVRVPALLYPWTGEKSYLDATLRTLEIKNQRHGLPVGLVSSEECLAGTGSTRHIETCNVACGPWTYNWLLRITGAASHADRMEQVFFNAAPVTVSRDFKLLSYYQTSNRVGTVLPGEKPRFGIYMYSKLGRGPKCCVGNSNRIVPNFIMHMWMATIDGGLAATMYGPCKLKTTIGEIPVTINAETIYPFEQSIRMTVETPNPVSFPLHLRIPSWCAAPKIKINNKFVAINVNANGFVVIKREWKNNDNVVLDFPMQPIIKTGRENPFPSGGYHQRDLSKLTQINNPYACVYYGPLLFSLPVEDVNPNEITKNAIWNYALNVDPQKAQSEIKILREAMPTKWEWPLNAPLKLTVPAVEFDWKPIGTQPLPKQPVEGGKPTTVTLVPYGCTKYRISMFPVTTETWKYERR